MKGNIYTTRKGWYTLFVSTIITLVPNFSTGLSAQICTGFRTETQRDWGEQPRRNNAAAYMFNHFAAAFPTGLTVGCDNKLVLTSPQAISDLLPLSGRIGKLPKGTMTNPNNRRFTNPFAGQVVTLKLNVTFDINDANFSTNTTLLKDLVVRKGPFVNRTVAQVLDEAEKALGGCPVQHSLYELNEIVTRINRNYMQDEDSGRYLACPVVQVVTCANDKTAPVISGCPTDLSFRTADACFQVLWDEPSASDNCTIPPSLSSNYFSGTCFPIGNTQVVYTSTDSAGNAATCTFNVNIIYDASLGLAALGDKAVKIDLDAQAEPNRGRLAFVTESKMEIDYFILQKKMADGEFAIVETANGANNTGMNFYTLYDEAILEGDNTYRVISVSVDGTETISTTKTITFKGTNQVKVYPNPASDFLSVDLSPYEGKEVNVYLYNQAGQLKRTYVIEEASAEPFNIEVGKMINGTYMLRIASKGTRDVTKQVFIAQ